MQIDKRGLFLAETTVKVIIAVICIVILGVLGFKLAGIVRDNHNIQTAETHMEAIEKIILDLEKAKGGEQEYILLNPNTWLLTGWPFTPLGESEEALPNNCNSEWNNCLCFCGFTLGDQVFNLRSIGHTGVLDACNDKKTSSCIEVKQEELVVNGRKLGIFPEKSTPISVEELVDEGKGITISLQDNKLRITPK